MSSQRKTKGFEGWLKENLPPGIPAEKEKSFLTAGLALSISWAALSYLAFYTSALAKLYTIQDGQRIFVPTARMADFGQVFRFTPAGYVLLAVWLLTRGFWFRAYHRQGSMSIYLMRRLPDPREYARRCWAVPLAGMGVCLVLTVATTALCYLIYMKCTPASCLAPGQWTRFWSALVGG